MKTFKTIIEPFRIHSVQEIPFPTLQEREKALCEAGYNLFSLRAKDILIDLLTDSGTGAMSAKQWAGMLDSDESYAGSRSFYRLQEVVHDLTGLQELIPTHQGRAAERILFETLVKPGDVVPNNTHFDTTRANIEYRGAEARDLLISEGLDSVSSYPFKGNMDTQALIELIEEVGPQKVPLVMLTVTNNAGGGQPVSMANLKAIRTICQNYNIPLYLDACRFAENAYLIKLREPGYSDFTPKQIAQEMFSLVDGCTLSAKKDGLSNMGGFLATNNPGVANFCRNLLILTEGFITYGGLAGYDMEAVAQGLQEVVQESYLHYRIRSISYLAEKILKGGVPIINPPGGHAVYLDAKAMLLHLPVSHYPAQALAVELYRIGGVRGVEMGSVMFGRPQKDREDIPAPRELVRLAIPRRTYTQSHMDYVAEVVIEVAHHSQELSGYRIVEQSPWLRHFTARLEKR